MAVQHKDIPDAQLHEPKGVASAPAKTVYVATGGGTGSWRKLNESDFDFSNPSNNLYGWNDISDSLYTTSSPRSIASATRTQITNNASAVQTNTSRLGNVWSSVNNQFNINDINSSYLLRVTAKVKTSSGAGTPYTLKLELQSDNGPLIISGSDLFIKGGSHENYLTCVFPFYMGTQINNYPLKLFVTPDTAITIYDIGFFLQRLYKES